MKTMRYQHIKLDPASKAERREMLRSALVRIKAAGEAQRIERRGGTQTARRISEALERGDTYAHPWLGGRAAA
jgi:hypothetical protein